MSGRRAPPRTCPVPPALAEQARVQLDGLGLRARVELHKVLAWQARRAIP